MTNYNKQYILCVVTESITIITIYIMSTLNIVLFYYYDGEMCISDGLQKANQSRELMREKDEMDFKTSHSHMGI